MSQWRAEKSDSAANRYTRSTVMAMRDAHGNEGCCEELSAAIDDCIRAHGVHRNGKNMTNKWDAEASPAFINFTAV